TLQLTDTGPQHDRNWVITDPEGMFFTQREHPRMALIQPRFEGDSMVLAAPGLPEIATPLYMDDAPHTDITVWRDTMQAGDAGDEMAAWLGDYLGVAARLFALTEKTVRMTDAAYSPQQSRVGFADGYPLLVVTEESLAELNRRIEQRGKQPVPMARFRPNVVLKGAAAGFDEDHWTALMINEGRFDVVKPCARCAITTVDPQTGTVPDVAEPLGTLATFRKGANGGVIFGQNVIHRANITLSVGDAVTLL
ncbi:MAG: MOSC N-terminal beta barrel domain-containing protein, partial [Chloroflexota bacterium]